MQNTTPLLELRGITKTFDGFVANDHIDLDVFPGEVHAVLGENGAGKSTMINIIIGNLAATKGKVLWNGHDVRRLGRQFRAVLGYMPQQQNLYDSFTGQRFLQYMAALKELPGKAVV